MRLLFSTVFLLVAAIASAGAEPAGGDRIVGEWRGTSICLHRELSPACRDEQVRYVFTRKAGVTDTFHQVADKMVSGSYQPMGEMDLVYSAKDARWSHEFEARTCPKCTWWYRLEPSGLVGGITDQAGTALRKVSAQRYVP